MRRLVLGTAGHIDHGKTTLVRALTGIDTTHLPEEKRRGITIDLGFARLPLGNDIEAGVVDVPGHEAFIRNMLAGATGIDLALLVVAADEGVMPQTREHLAILELLGIRAAVVALTKADLVDEEWLALVSDDVRTELAAAGFADAPILPVSGVTGEGVEELRAELAQVASAVLRRPAADLFRLPIDRVFTVKGTGTVVTGTVWSGGLGRDAGVRVLPAGIEARVRGLQVHGQAVARIEAGQRAAVALAGVDRERLARGDVLVTDAAWQSTTLATARLRVLRSAPPLRARQRIRFHLGAAEVLGRVALIEGREIAPGEEAWVQLRLEAPIVARAGDRFVIRSYSPVTTIGGGRIAEVAPARRKRLAPEDARSLGLFLDGAPADAVRALVDGAGWAGFDLARLPVATPCAPEAVRAAVAALEAAGVVTRIGARLFRSADLDHARTVLLDAVDRHHAQRPIEPGIPHEELRRALPPRCPSALADAVLAGLLGDGTLRTVPGGMLARAGFAPALPAEQRAVAEQIVARIASAGLTPPLIGELPPPLRDHPDLRAILRFLERDAQLVPVSADLYIAPGALRDAVAVIRRQVPADRALTPAEFKEILGISRKYLIPLLEHFDRTNVTVRRAEGRYLCAEAPV